MADPIPFDPYVPADLFAAVVEALEAANDELVTLSDGDECFQDAVMPEAVVATYQEHAAMVDVIRRIARAAPPERKRRLGLMCRTALAEHGGWQDMPSIRIPVMAEVLAQSADALELVRRRGLVDGHVRDALDPIRG